MTLDELAIKYKTDKSSKLHNYTEKYDRYFSPWREKNIKVLEIGIQDGYSLKTWKDYFPNAHIYGLDVVDCKHMDEDRLTTIRGSQNDLAALQRLNEQYGPFDIIIDDGSHVSSDMRISFDYLFPFLKPGGLYVVEDLHCCYWPSFRERTYDFMDRLKDLLDRVNSRGKCGLAEIDNLGQDSFYQAGSMGSMDWWDRSIEAIHLYRSIVFFEKSPKAELDDTFTPIDPPIKFLKNKTFIKNFVKSLWQR